MHTYSFSHSSTNFYGKKVFPENFPPEKPIKPISGENLFKNPLFLKKQEKYPNTRNYRPKQLNKKNNKIFNSHFHNHPN